MDRSLSTQSLVAAANSPQVHSALCRTCSTSPVPAARRPAYSDSIWAQYPPLLQYRNSRGKTEALFCHMVRLYSIAVLVA